MLVDRQRTGVVLQGIGQDREGELGAAGPLVAPGKAAGAMVGEVEPQVEQPVGAALADENALAAGLGAQVDLPG